MKKRIRELPQKSAAQKTDCSEDLATKRWREENREAIESRNRFVEEHGLWGEKYREW